MTDQLLSRAALRGAALAMLFAFAASLSATSVIPIGDAELYRRADVVVRGIVVSSDTVEAGDGWPETVTVIAALRAWKGALAGDLILHQAGGVLPDGRFFKLWGRPEYAPGDEVIVFAIRRPEGDFQTAEMLLGKFAVASDDSGRLFAVPDLTIGAHPGVSVHRALEFPDRLAATQAEMPVSRFRPDPTAVPAAGDWDDAPRDLSGFLDFLEAGATGESSLGIQPAGGLTPVVHAPLRSGMTPQWGMINDSMFRWNNGATAAWSFVGTANMTGGGTAEATNALASWTNDPNSNINYTASPSGANQILLSATSSPCGWTDCITSAGGVIGCGGPQGISGSNTLRGDSYSSISSGKVWLRCYATTNAFGSVTTQSVLTHELGHSLGLGHSDQNTTVHDTCLGDEPQAIMRSVAQNRTTLGTDDQDAIRWLYGDGGTHCANPPAPSVAAVTPGFGPIAGGSVTTITGANFVSGATVSIGGVAATGVTFLSSSQIRATAPAHGAGTVDVAVTNPDAQNGSLAGAFDYQDGTGFYTLTPCRVLDTRNPSGPLGGPALSANSDRTFSVTGHCGIPAGAKALIVNLTVTQPSAAGDLRLYAAGSSLPNATNVQYHNAQTRANNAVISISPGGAFTVHCDQTAGSAQFLVDVNGYLQ